jgi:precorrin-2/cobalt-factor-2 C20-methyltransferase
MRLGKFWGVGVGPGDPELLTLKAVRVLHEADSIYAASSEGKDKSVALTIATPHLNGGRVERLGFPMTRDEEVKQRAWRENAERVLTDLRRGETVCFLTLGDPLTYSTFGYLMQAVREMEPEVEVRVAPGVSAVQAAAAASGEILVEGEETLTVVSGAEGGKRLEEALDTADCVAVLKVYKNFEDIRETLRRRGLLDRAVMVSRCGMGGDSVVRDVAGYQGTPEYFSLILVRQG